MMKFFHKILLFLIPYTLSFTLTNHNNFLIEGHLSGNSEEWVDKVYLLKLDRYNDALSGNSGLIIDSAIIDEKGNFIFNNAEIIEGNFLYRLNVIPKSNYPNGAALNMQGSKENAYYLHLNKDSKVEFNANINQLAYTADLNNNSTHNSEIKSLMLLRKAEMQELDSIMRLVQNTDPKVNQNTNTDEQDIKHLKMGFMKAKFKYEEAYATFSDTSSSYFASILASNYIRLPKDSSLYSKLKWKYLAMEPNHVYSDQFSSDYNDIMVYLPIGSVAPNISLPDSNGTIRTLSENRGYITILDFWASWCKPCRSEIHKHLKPLYTEFKDQGLKIYSVSQDGKKANWTKAIIQDKVTWTQVSDLNPKSEVFGTYNIQVLPMTYVIGKDGKILARGLRGEELESFVRELFKN